MRSLGRRRFQRGLTGASMALVGILAACDDRRGPTQPTVPPGPPSAPAPAPVEGFVDLRVEGPASVPPDEIARYTATGRWSDGSTRDVTSEAKWSSTDESVLFVTVPGTIAARSIGEAEVRAVFAGRSHGRPVVVVPAGRLVLRLRVVDGLIPAAPLFDARVEVISGPAKGLSGNTDWYGGLSLFGVPAEVELRVTKDGFHPIVRSIQVGREAEVQIHLMPSVPRLELSGRYELMVTSGICSGGGVLPDAVRTRTYTAAISEPGGKVRVLLSGAEFALKDCCFGDVGNGFTGQTQALDTRFTLVEYAPPFDFKDGIHPSVAERLADGTVLSISGRAVVKPTPEGFAGTLDGSITIFDSLPLATGAGRVLASCRSSSHRFALVR